MTTGGGGEFVGRGRELEALSRAAAEVASGRSVTVLLEAPSGMGATSLLRAFAARLAAGAMPGVPAPELLIGDDLPAWRGSSYGPFRIGLERLLAGRPPGDVERLLGPGAELLLPLVPAAAARLGVDPVPPRRRERLPDRMLEGFRGVVGRLAEDRPVVLVVEDLHVLDAASRALVAFLARTLGERPVLILGSYQPEALGPGHPLRDTLDALGSSQRPPTRLAVRPLDGADLRAMIGLLEGEAPSAPVLLLVAERSGGSPLVAAEVLAARRELAGASLSLPLHQIVLARAARRSPQCRRVLRMLALAGGPLRPDRLAAATAAYDLELGRSAPRSSAAPRRAMRGIDLDLAVGIDEAIEHGFAEIESLEPGGGGKPGDRARRPTGGRLRIRHELLAAALAADLLPGPRRRLHAALAVALESLPAEACRHWGLAHEEGRQVRAALDAAAEAEAFGAADDAGAFLEEAIGVADAPAAAGTVTPEDEVDLLARAAEACSASGDTGRALAFAEAALARHPRRSERAVAASLTERTGRLKWTGGDRDGARQAFERSLELLPVGATADRSRLLALVAQSLMLEGSFSDAERTAVDAIDSARRAGDDGRSWLGHATCTLGVVESWLGRPEAAVDHLGRALDIAEVCGSFEDAFRARANLATALDLQGRRADAVEVSLAGIAAAEAAGLEVAHGNLLRANAVDALVSLGRWSEARTMARRALEWAPSGMPLALATLGLATIEVETRADEVAARLLGRLFLEVEPMGDPQYAVPAYEAAASLALWRGDLADAYRAVGAAWSRVRGTEHWALAARTAAAAFAVAYAVADAGPARLDVAGPAGVRSWAERMLGEATRMVGSSGAPADSWIRRQVEADLATARAYRERLAGRDDPATWTAVAAGWAAVDRVYDEARALHRAAEAQLRAGPADGGRGPSRGEARGSLLRAAAIALDLDALPLLRSVADLAARARIELPPAAVSRLSAVPREVSVRTPAPTASARRPLDARATPADSFGLSARERGVLAEIVAGRTNRGIGERLYISEKTVGVHVGNILAKLGVGGRVEAATVALRLGLVDDLLADVREPGPRGPGSRRRRGAA